MQKIIFIFFFFLSIQNSLAQTLIKAKDLQKDYQIVRQSYEQMHPGIYKYQSKTTIDNAFAILQKAWNHDQTLTEAYKNLNILTASFQCGHSYPNFFNQEEAVKKEIFEQKNTLPFHFKLVDNRMLVYRTAQAEIKDGWEIKKINGVSITKILKTLMPIVRADGASNGKRLSLLENGKEYFSYFDIFYPMYYPQAQGSFTLNVFDSKSNNSMTISTLPVNHAERDKVIKAKYSLTDAQKFSWHWLNASTAIMTINNFNNYNGKTNFQQFYYDCLQDYLAKNGKNLIIDIRKNEGGNSSEMQKLIPLLTDKPITYTELQNTWQMIKIDSTIIPYVSNASWAKGWFNMDKNRFNKTELGQYQEKSLALSKIFQPAAERFGGKVYLMISPTNSSATYMMAETFKKYKLATLIGQTTGGNQRGITSSSFFFMLLPNSKLELDVPLIGTDLALAKTLPNAGISPDIFVKPSVSDFLNGIDTEIEFLKKILTQ